MAVSPEYRAFAMEQLGRCASVTARSMFGGVGIYADGLFFAVMDDDRLYLKADDTNRPDFQAAGMGPFAPMGPDKPMQYYELPADLLEDHERLCPWVHKAVDVARRKGKRT